jgi:hypothetical protein
MARRTKIPTTPYVVTTTRFLFFLALAPTEQQLQAGLFRVVLQGSELAN